MSDGGKIHVKGTSRLTYERGNISGEGSRVNTQTFFMGVFKSYGGDQFLSVNNKGEINASEKLSPGIIIKIQIPRWWYLTWEKYLPQKLA